MEPLKNIYNEESLAKIAKAIKKVHPQFREKDFLKEIIPQIKNQEMKDRVRSISKCLKDFLPEFNIAAIILVKSVRSEKNPEGISDFLAWPFTQFIEDFGTNHWNISMTALQELTKVMSAEFAIRPFLIQHHEKTLHLLLKWTKHENKHVRRLCSEGSRPRLPWGQRIKKFQDNPNLTLPILRALKNDSELYVRKSVANHLNDISKDHPKIVLNELRKWLKSAPNNKNILWIARHACRGLIKSGDASTLQLFGIKPAKAKKFKLQVTPAKLKMGGKITFIFEAWSSESEKWLIDYIVHHKKANGSHSPKTFKWTERSVERGLFKITKNHVFRKITTRKYYSGIHYIEILLNGKSVAKKSFQLD